MYYIHHYMQDGIKEGPIKSEKLSYYSFIGLGIIFGLSFFCGGLAEILDPNGTVTVNGTKQQANLFNMAPFLLVGIGALGIIVYYYFNLSLAEFRNDSIILTYPRKRFEFLISQIKCAEITSFINDYCIKLQLEDNSTHKIKMDSVKFKLSDLSNFKRPYYRTKMWQKLKERDIKIIQ